jgi:PBP1b-binding outer membrane lipoprotein LpoB
MIKNSILLLVICLLFFFSSCSNTTEEYYQQHSELLEKLAANISSDTMITDVCCIKDACFKLQELEWMQQLKLECIRKDTVDGTVNFILGNQGKYLQSVELVFQYNNKSGEPMEYPNAGIYVRQIAGRWYIREYHMD